jgi:hypothetical protein
MSPDNICWGSRNHADVAEYWGSVGRYTDPPISGATMAKRDQARDRANDATTLKVAFPDAAELEHLRAYSQQSGVPMAIIVRRAVRRWMESHPLAVKE